MSMEMLIVGILTVVSFIFFVWGTSIASVKHVGIGGILLSIAVIFLLLLGAK